jgi:3-hydroxyisobutyrate dehydrogenase-like beta-hydroxyacid dehydrogenase
MMMMHRSLQRMARKQHALVARGFASDSKDLIGLVGIGQMGNHMANNLIAKGQKVVVFDVNADSTKPLAAKGAIVASTAREVAEKCDRVVTMLPNTAIVEQVYLHDKDGFSDVVRPSHLFIDSSTIDAIFTKKLSEIYHEKGAKIVDAPVSGGVIGAENGTLTFMVGGTEEEFQMVKPTLEYMGRNIVHCGSSCTYAIVGLYGKVSN